MTGLKGKLIKSHLMVAFVGVILLGMSLLSVIWLKQDLNILNQYNIPMVRVTENIQTQLQVSLAELRGWMNVKDKRFVQERQKAWNNNILPSLHQLDILIAKSGDKILAKNASLLREKLNDLKMWQWRIEDVAQTPGNYPAEVFMKEHVLPSSQKIVELTTSLIELEKKSDSASTVNVFHNLADFRGYFTLSLSELTNYILVNSQVSLENSRHSLLVSIKSLNKLKSQQNALSAEQQEILSQLLDQFDYYPSLVAQLVTIKIKYGKNLASSLLSNKAIPIARSANQLVSKMINMEVDSQKNIIDKTASTTISIICGIVVFIVLLLLISFWMAQRNASLILRPIKLLIEATKNIASGKEGHAVTVQSHDEVGKLTESFNKMLYLRKLAEEKMKKTVETAVDPIITINDKGIIQSCNSATTKLLNFEEGELIGENISIIMPEPYHSNHDQYIKNYIETHNKKVIGFSREVAAKTKGGEIIPVTLSVSEIMVNNERFFTGIIHDIRKEKEQVKRITQMNERLEMENLEKSTQTNIENALRGVDDLEQFSEIVLQFFEENFEVLLSIFYIINEEAEEIQMVSALGFKDRRNRKTVFKWGESLVGECVSAKKILSINDPGEDYFKVSSGLGEKTPKHILLIPLIYDGVISGVVELAFLNQVPNEIQKRLENLCSNITINLKMSIAKQKLQLLLEKTEAQKQSLQQQEEELRSSNEELETQASALKQSEEELRSTNDELTAQVSLIEKQKQELDEKSSQVEKASQYKSEFIANMSHELRTPLNSLLILAQSFMSNKQGNLTDDQVQEAKIIYQSGNDLLTLINDILDISKIEAGKFTFEIANVELSEATQFIKEQFDPIAKNRGVEFIVSLSEAEGLVIQTDKLRLLQVLKNLLSNAFKFTESGSVKLLVAMTDKNVQFKVIDTGIGIAKEKQKLVFSEFQQADGSTSRKYGGTGLGLSISRKLAHLMGGQLDLESEEGKGSTFILSLPIRSKDGVEQKVQGGGKKPGKAEGEVIDLIKDIAKIPNDLNDDRDHISPNDASILIIDDDVNFQNIISKMMTAKHFKVLKACLGKSGMMLAAAYQPSGIILDLTLPDIEGKTVLDLLSKDIRTSHIPVHIISGQDKSNELLDMGAFSFLQKPVNQTQIENILRTLSSDHSAKVLIVEDDRVTQKGLKELFSSLDHVIDLDFVDTAKKAKEIVRLNQYNAIIIDLGLPDEAGIKLIEALVDEMHMLIPIIVYTARELTPEEFRAIKKYTNKVVIKGKESIERLLDEVQLFVHHIKKKNGNLNQIDAENTEIVNHSFEEKFKDKRVLLVDDDLRNTFALSKVLQSEGFVVVIADNGKMALDKLNEEPAFDVVLMDIMMPVMDGYEAINAIRKSDQLKNLTVIALTAKATEQDREQCLEAGANDYMSKPINVSALLELLSIWIENPGDRSA